MLDSAIPGADDIKQELTKSVEESFGVNQSLIDWKEKDPDDFEAKIMQIRPADWQKFFTEDKEIDRETLRNELTTHEKFSMLASHILGDQIFNILFPGKKDGVKTLSMEEATDYFTKNPDKGGRKFGDHLVWDQKSPFSQIKTLFSLADLVTNKSETGNEAFPLVPGTFWFVSMAPAEGGPKIRPTMYSVMKKACERVGVELTFLRPGERPIEKPNMSKKEIKLSFLNQALPVDSAGKIDVKLLDWYVECYDMAPCMIMQGGALLAAILKRKGEVSTAAVAVDKDHANYPADAATITLLDTIVKAGTEAPAAAPAEAPKPKSDLPKKGDALDKDLLTEWKSKYEKGEATWLSSYQKAAVFVLQGSPVDQALKAAGVLETDVNHAVVKTELETLKA